MGRYTDFLVTRVADDLIGVESSAGQDEARAAVEALVEPFVDEIVSADLDSGGAAQIAAAVNLGHVLCTLCAELLRVVDGTTELTDEMLDEIAAAVAGSAVKSLGGGLVLENGARVALRSALRRA